METKNHKTNDPHKFVLNLLQRLDLKKLNKHVALQNYHIYYTRKNEIQQHKNNKTKNNSSIVEWYEIQDYIEHNIKNPEKLPTKPPIYICINKINNRLVFEIKYEYKL